MPTCSNGFTKAPFVVPTGWDEVTNTVIVPVVASLCALTSRLMRCRTVATSWRTPRSPQSDEEECVELHFPPLSIELVGSQRSIQTLALADTGASSPFLSGRIVDTLGLEK
jgi:hypothetical protein